MNINYIQYRRLKNCKKIEICEHSLIGYNRNNAGVVVPITNKQYEQEHDKLVYGYKWERRTY